MYPVLFKLTVFGGNIQIGSYRFFLILAMIVGVGLAWLIARGRGLPSRQTLILLLAAAAAIPVGARLLHAATNYGYYADKPQRLFSLEPSGFALFGGLVLAAAVSSIIGRLLRLDFWRTVDAAAPALGISIATVRIGCFLEGCCRGISSSLPWAVTFPNDGAVELARQTEAVPIFGAALREIAARPVATHPVDIYELLAALAGAVIAVYLLRRRAVDGVAFLAFALGFSLFRLANHPLRAPTADFAGPDWFYPALYVAALTLSLTILYLRLSASNPLRNKSTSRSASASAL